MTDIINFLINNRDNWLPLLLVSAIVTAVLSFQYFFIYAYIINRRLKNPEKKHRLKLIMPRFACIVFAIIALLGTAKFLPGLWWQLDYSYVQSVPDGENYEDYAYTREQLDNNEDFKLYTTKSENFEYSLYRNEHFNGIIDCRYGKNHEYYLFIKYIGNSKKLNGNDYLDTLIVNYSSNGIGQTRGGGYTFQLSEEADHFGSPYHSDTIGIDLNVYKEKDYKKYVATDSDEKSLDEICVLNEKTQFSFKDNTFSKPIISGHTVKS